MKNVKLFYVYVLTAFMVLGVFSCSKDEPEPAIEENEPDIDVSDSDPDPAEALAFENAKVTVVKESFPEPTGGAGAPVLVPDEDDENVLGISGGKLSLDFDESTGAALKGAYVQIDGADHYYDVAFNNSESNNRIFIDRKGRTSTGTASVRMQGVESLLLTLPEDLEAGNFCLTYAVYDDQNRVSNPIELCVEVKGQGGENSNFLTANAWAMELEYWTETDNGETYVDTTVIGKLYEDAYTYSYSCPGDTATKEVILTESYTLDYVHITFSTDGTVTMEERESEKQTNADAICVTGHIQLIDSEQEIVRSTGTWSYDDSNKELAIMIEHVVLTKAAGGGSDEPAATEEFVDTDLEVYQVKQENGRLILTSDWDKDPSVSIFKAGD